MVSRSRERFCRSTVCFSYSALAFQGLAGSEGVPAILVEDGNVVAKKPKTARVTQEEGGKFAAAARRLQKRRRLYPGVRWAVLPSPTGQISCNTKGGAEQQLGKGRVSPRIRSRRPSRGAVALECVLGNGAHAVKRGTVARHAPQAGRERVARSHEERLLAKISKGASTKYFRASACQGSSRARPRIWPMLSTSGSTSAGVTPEVRGLQAPPRGVRRSRDSLSSDRPQGRQESLKRPLKADADAARITRQREDLKGRARNPCRDRRLGRHCDPSFNVSAGATFVLFCFTSCLVVVIGVWGSSSTPRCADESRRFGKRS